MHIINIQNNYKKFYSYAVKAILLACLIGLFTPTLAFSEDDHYATDEEAYRIESVKAGVNYYYTFTIDALDEKGNDVLMNYGIMLKTSTGADTNSITGVITSYADRNYAIKTSGNNDFSFEIGSISNTISYFVTKANGSALVATNNRNNFNDSLFVGNSATLTGSALKNEVDRSSITGDFIGNTIYGTTTGLGGALHNSSSATINNLTGNFIANSILLYSTSDNYNNGGAAIDNAGTINYIYGDFIGNYITAQPEVAIVSGGGNGGAIFNSGTIQSIIGDFLANRIIANAGANYGGGAIYNSGSITSIHGNFIENYLYNYSTNTQAHLRGGGIYNYNAFIDTITGDFLLNIITSQSEDINNEKNGAGGAISNYAKNEDSTINTINANFIENSANGRGGAISNEGTADGAIATIGSISGNFIENQSNNGGAIENLNNAHIGAIYGDFASNTSSGVSGGVGGAIRNYVDKSNGVVSIGKIVANFVNNISGAYGGAIYNGTSTSATNASASIGSIEGVFVKNEATSGGAIMNNNVGYIGSINANFYNNIAKVQGNYKAAYGGAIYNGTTSTIDSIKGDFYQNSAERDGGAIFNYNTATITNINGDFVGNSATGAFNNISNGGAIYNSGTLGNLTGDFSYNSAYTSGGAIYNTSSIGAITGSFIGNSAGTSGGAIYNTGGSIGTIIGSFLNNSAGTSGGAIYTTTALDFLAANKNIVFSNNYTGSATAKTYNAIDTTANLTFKMSGTGSYTINDSITGTGDLYFSGDSASKNLVSLNHTFTKDNEVIITNATLRLGSFLHDNNTVTSALGIIEGTIEVTNGIFRINAKDYSAPAQTSGYTGSILDGVAITGDTNSQWIIENIANGDYDYGNSSNTSNWNGTYATGNSLQSVTMHNDYFEIKRVVNSVLYEGPMGDIIKDASNSTQFGSLTNSLLGNYIANTTDFIYGGTNWLVGTEKQQAAFIEGSAKMSSVIGVNANTLHINRAGYEAISLRRLDAHKRQRSNLEEKAYASKVNPDDIIIYDANGRIKEEHRNEYELPETSAFKRVIENNNLAAWLAPMYHYEEVHGMASDGYFAGYNANIYGAKLGLDMTTQDPRSRSGIAIAAGKGTSTSSADFKDIENEYSFYSISAYESFNIAKCILNANLGYTRMQNTIMHDLTAFEMQNLYADVDSFIWNLAFNAEYEKSYKNILFSPHIGLELLYLTSNDYKVKMGKNLGTIYNVDTNAQQLALIPLGIKIEKEFEFANNWAILPELDLNIMAALGEIDEEFYITTPEFTSDANLTGKVLDTFTYGAGLNVFVSKGNLGLGLNYNFNYSANRMAHSSALQMKFAF